MNGNLQNPLNLKSLNHISLVCRSVDESIAFYQNVLGFVPVRRPGFFNFDGAWLFGYGIGIHLLQSEDPESMEKKTDINPKDNHLSFQCESMEAVEKKLREMEIKHLRAKVVEGGIEVDQLFFHDPDGFMIEICNCDSLHGQIVLGRRQPADATIPDQSGRPTVTRDREEGLVVRRFRFLVVSNIYYSQNKRWLWISTKYLNKWAKTWD